MIKRWIDGIQFNEFVPSSRFVMFNIKKPLRSFFLLFFLFSFCLSFLFLFFFFMWQQPTFQGREYEARGKGRRLKSVHVPSGALFEKVISATTYYQSSILRLRFYRDSIHGVRIFPWTIWGSIVDYYVSTRTHPSGVWIVRIDRREFTDERDGDLNARNTEA